MGNYVDIVFDGPPGAESGRFVEVEAPDGSSISYGTWVEREDGYHALRVPDYAADCIDLKHKLKIATEALRFYANEEAYEEGLSHSYFSEPAPLLADYGETARTALEKIGG